MSEGVAMDWRRPRDERGNRGRLKRRLVAELINYYRTRRAKLPREPPSYADEAVRAEELKVSIYEYVTCGDISVPCPKVPFRAGARQAFWESIALTRLRFQGGKRTYAVWAPSQQCRGDGPSGERVLTLHIPPAGRGIDGAERYDEMHAALQASYQDNDDGIFPKGLRINADAWRSMGLDPEAIAEFERGYKLRLREWPKQHRGRHYGGALEHPDKLQREHLRMLEKGYVEGPLHYAPWVVQSLGGVWKPERDKWRTIMDATSSGVNGACLPLSVRYDSLGDAIAGMTPGGLVSGFDMSDAFLSWPYDQGHSDLMGYQDANGDFFRYRFMAFGCAQSPYFQQIWAERIRKILNEQGLKYCSGEAADYAGFKVVLAYSDDFAMVHPPGISQSAAEAQFDSCMRVLADLGVDEKVSKRSRPSTSVELLGFVINTVDQTVSLTSERCERYCSDIDDFLATVDESGDASCGRHALAAVVGRLQWCAQVVRGGQLHLRAAYRARDAFLDDGLRQQPLRAQWARGVRVRSGPEVGADLDWWKTALQALKGEPIFLSNLAIACGFWKGGILEDDAFLDAKTVSAEDVEVITTDASGYGGGAWWRLLRHIWSFEEGIKAPDRSSNYRELLTAVLSFELWGEQLRGRRILLRTDNVTTMSVVNKLDSKFDTLLSLARRLWAAVERYDLHIAARHIPGLHNGLSDGLSRWHSDQRDFGDWQFSPQEFSAAESWLQETCGRGFDVDACADPTGSNAHVERFWSGVDSALDHDMAGLHVWCNADWNLLADVLRHFKAGAATRPFDTAGVFVVPVKPDAPWWRQTKGFEVLKKYPAGTQLFTCQRMRDGVVVSGEREAVRPAKWPVLLLAWSPARRTGGGDARARGTAGADPHRAAVGDLALSGLRLSGDGARDAALLRRL